MTNLKIYLRALNLLNASSIGKKKRGPFSFPAVPFI